MLHLQKRKSTDTSCMNLLKFAVKPPKSKYMRTFEGDPYRKIQQVTYAKLSNKHKQRTYHRTTERSTHKSPSVCIQIKRSIHALPYSNVAVSCQCVLVPTFFYSLLLFVCRDKRQIIFFTQFEVVDFASASIEEHFS